MSVLPSRKRPGPDAVRWSAAVHRVIVLPAPPASIRQGIARQNVPGGWPGHPQNPLGNGAGSSQAGGRAATGMDWPGPAALSGVVPGGRARSRHGRGMASVVHGGVAALSGLDFTGVERSRRGLLMTGMPLEPGQQRPWLGDDATLQCGRTKAPSGARAMNELHVFAVPGTLPARFSVCACPMIFSTRPGLC
jgi:hypothetical protein